MNSVIFKKELKRNRKNTAIWTAIVVVFTALILSIFPSFSAMGEEMAKLMSSLPEEYAKALGMDEETWSSIIGYYGTYYGIYIILLIGIFTASTGATIIGKEERDGTAEFLLTRPISRGSIVWTKLMALGMLFIIIYGIQTLSAVIGLLIFGEDVNWPVFTTMHVHGFFLVGFFTASGVLMSSFLSPKLNYMGPIVGLIFGGYFLNAISMAVEKVSWLGYFSPYHYLNLTAKNGVLELNLITCLGASVVVAVFLWISNKRYLSRDIVG